MKSKKKTYYIIVYLNYYIYISNFVQKLLFTTYMYIHVINNKLF